MEKFAFLTWDWKTQFSTDALNSILASINEVITTTDVNYDGDRYVLAIHTPKLRLTEEEWVFLFNCQYRGRSIPDYAPKAASYCAAPVNELKKYLATIKEENEREAKISAEKDRQRKIKQLKDDLSKLETA